MASYLPSIGGRRWRQAKKSGTRPAPVAQPATAKTTKVKIRQDLGAPMVEPSISPKSKVLKSKLRQLKVKGAKRRAPATTVQNAPTASKNSESTPHYIPMATIQKMGDWQLEGHMTSETISFNDGSQPPRPIELCYTNHQTGSRKTLDSWKTMYKTVTDHMDSIDVIPNLVVGGTDTNSTSLLQNSTAAGYGRANVHWPFAIRDHLTSGVTGKHNFTMTQSCFNRNQIRRFIINQLMENSQDFDPTDFDDEINAILSSLGDTKVFCPFDEFEVEFKYVNNNLSLPMMLSLYLCIPQEDLKMGNVPQFLWFNPFKTPADSSNMKMPRKYAYNPIPTAEAEVMYTLTGSSVTSPTMVANAESIMSMSTEVVRDASPDGFSQAYRNAWETAHVQKVELQPQQELIVKCKVKMSQMLDLKKYLISGDNSMYKGATIFPMVKFWGPDTVGVSSNLERNKSTSVLRENRWLESTAPRTGPCMLSQSQKVTVRCHVNPAALGPDAAGDPYQGYLMRVLTNQLPATSRRLLPYNDRQRGEQNPYFRCNDFLGYFINVDVKPTVNKILTSLCEIDTMTVSLAGATDPLASQIIPANTKGDWGVVDIETVSKTTARSASAEITVKS